MTNSISSVNSAASSSSSSSAVKEDTKKKLKALGLDPSKYTTESKAQAALTKAQEAQTAGKSGSAQGAISEATIKTEISALAANIGVTVGTDDKISDIMSKVSIKIDSLMAQAGSDPTKKSEAETYSKQYTAISNEYSQMQAAKNMTGATAMANYTKYALGLS